ncbi:MAG: sigma-70 family RNA polymerase sigma factor [Deltaproteobacteria bacterium]|nr:sigma-70 family RNA polymerase sigma factor [Deltaproteobacteria bacterium]MBK8235780.1 sigma-70 family RNA polymerase sigma factor [Deltaproteobacteria bacterium]MBP7288034.1 sigma-70 family RNA polymerase sigma factor [Nannocystaceae bacterium]
MSITTPSGATVQVPELEAIYREHHTFVWRSLRRLGVPDADVDDLVQEVFVVVHRRLPEFEGRSAITTWLFGIAFHVMQEHRRRGAARARREEQAELGRPPTAPDRSLSRVEAVGVLDDLLTRLDDDQRSVFVMAEVAKMTAPEIAELTGAKLNTVYSRLRLARRSFDAVLDRFLAQRKGELPWMTS